jgi:hypothetical protein
MLALSARQSAVSCIHFWAQPSAYFPQDSFVPLARGFVWDSRDPDDCVPMQPGESRDIYRW